MSGSSRGGHRTSWLIRRSSSLGLMSSRRRARRSTPAGGAQRHDRRAERRVVGHEDRPVPARERRVDQALAGDGPLDDALPAGRPACARARRPGTDARPAARSPRSRSRACSAPQARSRRPSPRLRARSRAGSGPRSERDTMITSRVASWTRKPTVDAVPGSERLSRRGPIARPRSRAKRHPTAASSRAVAILIGTSVPNSSSRRLQISTRPATTGSSSSARAAPCGRAAQPRPSPAARARTGGSR